MFYKIVEVSTDKASGHTYVLVHFWRKKENHQAGKPPVRINDFLMQLRPMATRLIDPDKPELGRETFDRDLPTQIKANIEAYWDRAETAEKTDTPYPADHRNQRIERDDSDPHGVLARADVAALRGTEVER